MLKLQFDNSKPLDILCLGAHCDDIDIGCGGSLLQLLNNYENVTCNWVVFCSDEERAAEARSAGSSFQEKAIHKKIVIHQFRDGFLPWLGHEVKDLFEKIKIEFTPDIIFTHYREDFHQDHRLISELTWNTFRNHLILEYEIPKYDGDLGKPNVFIPVDEINCQKKVDIVTGCYKSQGMKSWFTEDIFFSLLRIRGMESNAPSRYAEAFYCRKLVL
jgi:LmbE family N-acetylglucosaminyl deacetylase